VTLTRGTAVAMFVPEGAKAGEVDKGHAVQDRWPFLEVRDLLSSRGVDVPAVYGEDTSRGWVLLEDLGDQTLASFLRSHPGEREALYCRAVADLARAQEALAILPEGSVVASRVFDQELLSWEIDHFREWALEARGVVLSSEDRALFASIGERLARSIAAWPRTFVHRDYQSRNLMVRPDRRLCWVDFQDALLGPRVYDLVALLNDSRRACRLGPRVRHRDGPAQAQGRRTLRFHRSRSWQSVVLAVRRADDRKGPRKLGAPS
jgi:hypothetical protein